MKIELGFSWVSKPFFHMYYSLILSFFLLSFNLNISEPTKAAVQEASDVGIDPVVSVLLFQPESMEAGDEDALKPFEGFNILSIAGIIGTVALVVFVVFRVMRGMNGKEKE